MSEKIIIEEGGAEDEMDAEVMFATAHDYIASAVQALTTVLEIDTALLTRTDEKRIYRIKRQSIRLLSHYIDELYDETFDPADDDADS